MCCLGSIEAADGEAVDPNFDDGQLSAGDSNAKLIPVVGVPGGQPFLSGSISLGT